MSIDVENLTKHYNKPAIEDLSFQLKRGFPLALLGRNGAGKSTVIKLILGLIKPTSGTIMRDPSITIGYLPEERGVYLDSTVEEHLIFFAKISKVKDVKKASEYWLKRLELTALRDFKLKYLSKGNAQKVQLAITLIHNPEFVILDEPFSGLDPVSMSLFYQIIKEEAESKYMIISSHQMNKVENICNEIIFLNKGTVIAQGDIEQIKGMYGDKRIRMPKTPELLNLFRDYDMDLSTSDIIIQAKNNLKDHTHIISKIQESQLDVAFVNYEPLSLEELFVQILGGE